MKERADITRGWLRKAASDFIAMEASQEAGALDSACFHAQQASEKYLKAFLSHHGVDFPRTHNLARLIALCASLDPFFETLLHDAEILTPYAVEVRYDDEFWPSAAAAEEARMAAARFREAVQGRLHLTPQ